MARKKKYSKKAIKKIVEKINDGFDFDPERGLLISDFKKVGKWAGNECSNAQYALVHVKYKGKDWVLFITLTAASDPVTDEGPFFIVTLRVFRDVTIEDASIDDDLRHWTGEPGLKLSGQPTMRYEIVIGAQKNEKTLLGVLDKLPGGSKKVWNTKRTGRFNKTILV